MTWKLRTLQFDALTVSNCSGGSFSVSTTTLANQFFAEAMSPAFREDPYPL